MVFFTPKDRRNSCRFPQTGAQACLISWRPRGNFSCCCLYLSYLYLCVHIRYHIYIYIYMICMLMCLYHNIIYIYTYIYIVIYIYIIRNKRLTKCWQLILSVREEVCDQTSAQTILCLHQSARGFSHRRWMAFEKPQHYTWDETSGGEIVYADKSDSSSLKLTQYVDWRNCFPRQFSRINLMGFMAAISHTPQSTCADLLWGSTGYISYISNLGVQLFSKHLKTQKTSKNIRPIWSLIVSWLHNRFGPKSETFPILSSPWNDQEIPLEVRPIDFRTHGLTGWTWSQFLHGWPWLFTPNIHKITPARQERHIVLSFFGRIQKAMHPNHLEFQARVFSTSKITTAIQTQYLVLLHSSDNFKSLGLVWGTDLSIIVLLHVTARAHHFPACRCRMTSGKLSAAGGSIRSMLSSHGMLLPCLSAMSLSEFVWNHLLKKLFVSLPPSFCCRLPQEIHIRAATCSNMLQEISPDVEGNVNVNKDPKSPTKI